MLIWKNIETSPNFIRHTFLHDTCLRCNDALISTHYQVLTLSGLIFYSLTSNKLSVCIATQANLCLRYTPVWIQFVLYACDQVSIAFKLQSSNNYKMAAVSGKQI